MPRPKSTTQYFVGPISKQFNTADEAGAWLAQQESGDAFALIKGEEVPYTINREPTVTIGAVKAKPGRKPAIAVEAAPKRRGRKPGSKNKVKPTVAAVLDNGTNGKTAEA